MIIKIQKMIKLMNYLYFFILIAALYFVFGFLPAFAYAVETGSAAEGCDIIKLEEIEVGMKGIGRTVVSGSTIEEFDVEVLGILKNNKLDEALQISGSSILVRVSGDVIMKSGGIAAGMSGSPVYINGRLAGAIASGWIMTDHTIGLMTPIEEMLGLFKYMKRDKNEFDVNSLIDRGALLFERSPVFAPEYRGVMVISGADYESGELESYERAGYMVFKTAATPVIASGLNERNFGRLKEAVKRSGASIDLINSRGNLKNVSGDFEIPDLKPGHAVALQLVRGDINITAIGTLTYLKDNKFLAFAHSFIKKGNCSFFFTPANIYYCFYSHEMPFKIGAPGKLTGSVMVDRNEGVAGLIGVMPEVATVRAVVNDLDNGIKREFCSQIIKDPLMFPQLLQAVLTQAVDEGINRQGEGFARITYNINGRGEKSGEFLISRRNYYYDIYDIASVAIEEALDVSGVVVSNRFEKAAIYDVDICFEISSRSPCAKIIQASIDSSKFERGDTIEVSVTVEGDYKKPFVETFAVPLPLNMEEGEYNLKISNSDYIASITSGEDFELSSRDSGDSLELNARKDFVSFKDLINALNGKEKNNQIKIEFEPVFVSDSDVHNGNEASEKSGIKKEYFKRREIPTLDFEGNKKSRGGDRDETSADGRYSKKVSFNKLANKPAANSNVKKITASWHAKSSAGKIKAAGARMAEMISKLKSAYYSDNPVPFDKNYKFYKNFEYLFYPFNAQFQIIIGGGSSDGRDGENQNFDDI